MNVWKLDRNQGNSRIANRAQVIALVRGGNRMTLEKIDRPTDPAIPLAEVKQYLRVDGPDEDTLISSLVEAAVEYVEMHCRLTFLPTRWRMRLKRPPTKHIELPIRPLLLREEQFNALLWDESGTGRVDTTSNVILWAPEDESRAVESQDSVTIRYLRNDGTYQPWEGMWRVIPGNPPRILLQTNKFWPTGAINWPGLGSDFALEVEWTTGFGPDAKTVPAGLKTAILLLTGSWYLNREATGGGGSPLPFAVDMLLRQFDAGEYR